MFFNCLFFFWNCFFPSLRHNIVVIHAFLGVEFWVSFFRGGGGGRRRMRKGISLRKIVVIEWLLKDDTKISLIKERVLLNYLKSNNIKIFYKFFCFYFQMISVCEHFWVTLMRRIIFLIRIKYSSIIISSLLSNTILIFKRFVFFDFSSFLSLIWIDLIDWFSSSIVMLSWS